jgi:predicted RNase H-related nuclease YkuK (DUF458 family)
MKEMESFVSPTKGELSLSAVVQEIANFIGEGPDLGYSLVIGTDSQVKRENGAQEVDFVTAIIIHRRGKGGRYFWRRIHDQRIYSLKQKIFTEVYYSLEWAGKIVPLLKEEIATFAPYDLEIHVDVGEVGRTREMIKEVVGMITGNGYVAKTKPESYGASSVADRHT